MLVKVIGEAAQEVDDPELLNVPVEGVDVYVTSKEVDGKTLAELAKLPAGRGRLPAQDHRGARSPPPFPILPNTKINRGDILTLVGRTQDTTAAAKVLGVPDRPTDVADMAFVGAAVTIGALIGALVLKVAGVPLTLSTAGGALIAGHRVRLAPLDAPVLRAHPVLHRLVHELRRPQHLHRHRRHLGRARASSTA